MSIPCPGGCGLTYEIPPDRYCERCGQYLEDMMAATTDPSPAARDALPDTRPEVDIRMAIRKVLELHGFVVVDFEQGYRPDGSTRVRKGLPDLYCMGHGTSAWIEVKAAKGRLSEHQKAFRDDCQRAGVAWFCWRSEAEAIQWAEDIKHPNTRRTA